MALLAFALGATTAIGLAAERPHASSPAPTTAVLLPAFGDPATRDTLESSAFGLLVKTHGRLPSDEAGLVAALRPHSAPRSVWIPFSANPKKTSFCEPRLVLGAFGPPSALNGLDLQGKLFFAVIPRTDGKKDLEFISKNERTGQFDFGIVENFGRPAEAKVRLADKSKCMTCHRTGGPLFSDTPWSQSVLNPAMLRVMAEKLPGCRGRAFAPFRDEIARLVAESEKFSKDPKQRQAHFENALAESPIVRETKLNGVPIYQLRSDATGPTEPVADLDATISTANRSQRVLELVEGLRDPKDRATARALVAEIAARSALGDGKGAGVLLEKLKTLLKNAAYRTSTFPSLRPFRMSDFNPAMPGGVRRFGEGIGDADDFGNDPFNGATLTAIRDHDAARVAGTYSAPKHLSPANAEAFGEKPLTLAEGIDSMDVDLVKHAVALHDRDATAVLAAAKLALPNAPPAGLADVLLAQSAFRAASVSDRFPNRDDFQRAIWDALEAVGKKHGASVKKPSPVAWTPPALTRKLDGTTGPTQASGNDRCVSCHRTVGKAMPIAPDDWERWRAELASPDSAKRSFATRWLRKTIAALEDESMPPPESEEAKGFAAERTRWLRDLKELLPRPPAEMPR